MLKSNNSPVTLSSREKSSNFTFYFLGILYFYLQAYTSSLSDLNDRDLFVKEVKDDTVTLDLLLYPLTYEDEALAVENDYS